MPEVTLSGGNVLVTLAIILIVLEGVSVVSKGIEAWKKLTGRDERAREMSGVKDRLSSLETWKTAVDHRLEQGSQRFKRNDEDMLETLKTLHRIVKHLQSGNDHEKLQQTDEQLYEYLLKRGVNRTDLD